jgi:hypothetical protein
MPLAAGTPDFRIGFGEPGSLVGAMSSMAEPASRVDRSSVAVPHTAPYGMQPCVPAWPSWTSRRSALPLVFAAQLIMISDLVGTDPLPPTQPSCRSRQHRWRSLLACSSPRPLSQWQAGRLQQRAQAVSDC